MSSIDDLTTPLSFDTIRGMIYQVLANTGATTTNWKPGAVLRTLISAVAIVLAGFAALIVLLARSAFLPLSSGEWLRLVAYYVYGVVRIEATFATGTVTLTNTGGGIFSAGPGEFTLGNPITGKLYTNISSISLGSNAVLDVPIAAIESGSASTSYAGEISQMVTSWTAVTCSNVQPVIGYDVEADEALRLRCTEKLGSLSPNGPSDAYGYIARSARRADGSPIGITRVRALPDGAGGVNVWVASVSGAVTPTDLAVIDEQIQVSAVPLCVVANVGSATPRLVRITYTVWLYNTSGLTVDDVKGAINAELASYFAAAPIGGNSLDGDAGFIFLSELSAVIGRARTPSGSLLPIVKVSITTPSSDVPVGSGQVPVLSVVAGSVSQITPVGL